MVKLGFVKCAKSDVGSLICAEIVQELQALFSLANPNYFINALLKESYAPIV
jgi:hypothetical protein